MARDGKNVAFPPIFFVLYAGFLTLMESWEDIRWDGIMKLFSHVERICEIHTYEKKKGLIKYFCPKKKIAYASRPRFLYILLPTN